jgi:heme oxygenase
MSVEALRLATRADHRAVESRSPMAWLDEPGLPVERYALLLVALASLYRLVDARLARAAACWMPDLVLPSRAALADADLAALGASIDLRACAKDDPDPDIAPIDGRAAFVGVLYVVEGSALGGRLIASRLRRDGRVPDEATQLLTLGSSVTPALRWRSVCAQCDAAFDEGVPLGAAVQAARAAFAWFDAPLRRRLPEPGALRWAAGKRPG